MPLTSMAVTNLTGFSWVTAGEADSDDSDNSDNGVLASSAKDNRVRQKIKATAKNIKGILRIVIII